jgi:hypothetical protein
MMFSDATCLIDDLEKLRYLLKLSQEQIAAIQREDMDRVDRILAAKGALIETISNVKLAVSINPEVEELVEEIKKNEEKAQEMLEFRLHAIQNELITVRKQKKARGAYFKFASIGSDGYDFRKDETVPHFFDNPS